VTAAGLRVAPEPEPQQLFDPPTVAARLAVKVGTVRALERRGELRGLRVAGRLRFSASAIADYLTSAESAPRRTPPEGLMLHGGRPRKGRR
jgi:excisionase family DNA binding protein